MIKHLSPTFTILWVATTLMSAQDSLPYHQIPEYPKTYTPATVGARLLDGLGYRYYWATKDLRPQDLTYQISPESRTVQETLQHIYGLSLTTLNGVMSRPNTQSGGTEQKAFMQLRRETLVNIKEAADFLREEPSKDLEECKIIFQRGDRSQEFPFWNLINGPIADAIWHTGQIVSFRRASGNPLPPGVSVFSGRTRER